MFLCQYLNLSKYRSTNPFKSGNEVDKDNHNSEKISRKQECEKK